MSNFSTDADILKREPDLRTFLPENQADFTPQHSAAHDEIIGDLQQAKIIDRESQIAEPSELLLLSVFKALEIIMRFLSANLDDKFHRKAEYYAQEYRDEFTNITNSLSVDTNEDGVLDDAEAGASQQPVIERW